MDAGNKMIKLFPGDVFGAKYVKAIKAPIPNVEIMPTGGVSVIILKSGLQMEFLALELEVH